MGGRLCLAFRQAISENNTGEMATALKKLASNPQHHPFFKLLISKLQTILAGSREPELWQDAGLFYMDAVEIKLLVSGH